VLLTLTARTPEDLGPLDGWLHDAYFEYEEIAFDQGSQVVAIPFAQEAGNAIPSPLASEHLRRTWRYEDWRIPFFRGSLTVRDAAGFDQDESGTGEPGMLGGISYSDGALRVATVTGPALVIPVGRLDLELALGEEVSFWVRRRIGRWTSAESDRREGDDADFVSWRLRL
jgi:hypothetical protein